MCYVALLLWSRLLVDAWLTFDARILSPVMVVATIAFVAALPAWWRGRGLLPRGVVAIGVTAWVVLSLGITAAMARRAANEGVASTRAEMRRSPLVRWARTDGKRYRLFSNFPEVLHVLARVDARGLPWTLDPPSRLMAPQQLDPVAARAFGDTLVRRGGVIVAFDAVNLYMVSPDSLARALSLRRIARFADGSVWAPATMSARATSANEAPIFATPASLGAPDVGTASSTAR